MKKDKIADIIFMFFFGSVIGWIWEVLCTLYVFGIFANRGVLHGPWLPIYGFGFLLMIMISKGVGKNPLLLFISTLTACGLLEFMASIVLEKLYHTRWWSYGDDTFNINGRVCLKSLLFFGIAGSLIVYGLVPFLDSKISRINTNKKRIIAAVLMLIFLLDFVFSVFQPNMGSGISEGI